jgi:uncharacterized protein (TIGR00255 family)
VQSVLYKADIDEEVTRLSAHFVTGLALLDDKVNEKGRRFDFLIQEMNRETNTIMSKTSVIAIAQAAIDIKFELEKMREQIQNIV